MRREKQLERKKKKQTARNQKQQKFRDMVANRPRQCGECRACCYVFPLGDKGKRMWCKHSTDKGCGCYEHRPAVCSGYKCLWLASDLPTAYRPDHCGLIITPRGTYEGHNRAVISEFLQDAHQSRVGKELIEVLKQNGVLIFVVHADGQIDMHFRHLGIGSEDREKLVESFVNDSKQQWQATHDASGHFDFGARETSSEWAKKLGAYCSSLRDGESKVWATHIEDTIINNPALDDNAKTELVAAELLKRAQTDAALKELISLELLLQVKRDG